MREESFQTLVEAALLEDIGNGDHSTLSCIPADARGRAVLNIKQEGILAGMEVARRILSMKEPAALFVPFKKDGDRVKSGEEAFRVEAGVHTLLQCERLILNCMQRMSGIATLTRRYVDALAGHHTRVLDTRKSTPNFRLLEKEAVRIGGGVNHRFGLYDMILLKDNHIDYCGGLEKAIAKALDYRRVKVPGLKIEVETRNLDDVRKIIAMGSGASTVDRVDRIMLDNFSLEEVRQAMALIGDRYETEASGGIHLDNIKEYAQTGVDFVSIGALIHQAQSIDLSLKAVLDN